MFADGKEIEDDDEETLAGGTPTFSARISASSSANASSLHVQDAAPPILYSQNSRNRD